MSKKNNNKVFQEPKINENNSSRLKKDIELRGLELKKTIQVKGK